MYPIQCAGGYALPIKEGKFEICGVQIPSSNTAAAIRMTLRDSDARKIVTDLPENGTVIFDSKGLANAQGEISVMFAEPIKVRNGVTIDDNFSNGIAGKNCVYVR